MLPISRRDIERLQQIIALQPRLLDLQAPPRTHRALRHRAVLSEAITWLEIHGNNPEAVEYWRALQEEPALPQLAGEESAPVASYPRARRRRRRRRGAPRATGGS
jgi:hypothetical protein